MASDELNRFCGFAERFLTDESSRPLVIERWQREILADYFAGTRELVVLVSKKNGKTSLFAGLALWHVITVAFADIAILAASRDQAGKLLSQLTGYIKRSSELREQLRITQRIVHCDRTDGKVAVMAADADTLDGWGGTLALVDELGRHKSGENFGLLRDGLGPRDGQLVAFSTAGDDEDSALGRIRARAHEMPGFGPAPDNAKHKLGRAEGFAFHEWSLDRGDDADDLELVALANPASWLDVAALRARKGLTVDAGVAVEALYLRPVGSRRGLGPQRYRLGRLCRSRGRDPRWRARCCHRRRPRVPSGLFGIRSGLARDGRRPDRAGQADHPFATRRRRLDQCRGHGRGVSGVRPPLPGLHLTFDPKAGGEQLLQRLEHELPDTHEFIEFPQMTGRLCGASMRFAELVGRRDDPPPGR